MKLSKDDVVQNFGVSLRYYNGLQVVNDKNMSSPEKAEGVLVPTFSSQTIISSDSKVYHTPRSILM